MCGIVAVITSQQQDLAPVIQDMTECLAHRGPDDSGVCVLPGTGAALGMRRLSIIDVAGGHQPMWNARRDVGLVFNGEIYNFAALRRELTALGHHFVTDHSDTEVLVHGYERWGEGLFERLHGQFATVIWDDRRRRLVIARDRAGEKPLYVAEVPGGYAIASELKAILRYPGICRQVDAVALEQYLAFDFVLAPRTMLRGVHKLPAGHYGIVTSEGYTTTPYWQLDVTTTVRDELPALVHFDALLDHAVSSMMVADVPVGLFLSGGLDSTTIGYYMRRHSDDVQSFSIGFDDPRHDETRYARLAAKHLGTRHHLEIFTEQRLRDLVPNIPTLLDEPMGDQSIFPTYLVSTIARKQVTVALGGDGGDEFLMGYRAYQSMKPTWITDGLPLPLRRGMAGVARSLPDRVGPLSLRGKRFVDRLDQPPAERLLARLGSFRGNARPVLSAEVRRQLPDSPFAGTQQLVNGGGQVATPANQTLLTYVRGYLQEDILVKVDRASMAASLEVRAPFLDVAVMEFLGAVSPSLKLHGMTRKYLLRRLMDGRIPTEIIRRPKQGFGVPMGDWLRGALSPLLREYLTPERLAAGGLFEPAAVSTLVEDHLSGRAERGHQLWLLLQLELWRERWLG